MTSIKTKAGDFLDAIGLNGDEENQLENQSGRRGGQSASSSQGRGWHGDSQGHAEAGREGSESTASSQGSDFYEEIGSKGGQAAQQSGNAHKLSDEERSRGGSNSGGNFANDPERASEAGKKGGKA